MHDFMGRALRARHFANRLLRENRHESPATAGENMTGCGKTETVAEPEGRLQAQNGGTGQDMRVAVRGSNHVVLFPKTLERPIFYNICISHTSSTCTYLQFTRNFAT